LVLHVERGADATLSAKIENATQRPGNLAPVSDIKVTSGHLAFQIGRGNASYEGDWDSAAQQWKGTLTTGTAVAVNLAKAGQITLRDLSTHRSGLPQMADDMRPISDPDPAHISNCYIERANLTMRMGTRRLTRLTNGFSKKIENHCAAVAIHVMHYNYARIHSSLRITPAMAAGVADHVWGLEEIANLAK